MLYGDGNDQRLSSVQGLQISAAALRTALAPRFCSARRDLLFSRGLRGGLCLCIVSPVLKGETN